MRLVQIPNFADLSIESKDPYGRDRDQWPIFRTRGADALLRHIDGFLEYCRSQSVNRPVLCFYFHPWEFWPMPQGLIHFGEGAVHPDPFITKNCGEPALRQLDGLIAGLKARGGRFITAARCAQQWRTRPQPEGHFS